MTSLRDWLKPTLLGPLVTTWGVITFGTLLVGMAALTGGRLDSWLFGMLLASFFGAGLGVLLIGVDVLLLRMKLRQLPTGARAWISSLLTPIGVFFIWSLPLMPAPENGFLLLVYFVVPMIASCAGARLIFGQRP